MSPVEWYYARGGQRFGPVAPPQLKQLADTGQLVPDDLVWQDGMKRWFPARLVKGLFTERSAEAVPAGVVIAEPPSAAAMAVPPATEPPAAVIVVGDASPAEAGLPGNGHPPVEAVPAGPLEGEAARLPGITAIPPADEPADPDENQPSPEARPAFEQSAAAYQRSREGARRHLLDYFLDLGRSLFRGAYADSAAELFSSVGHYGLYAVMLLWLIVNAAQASRQKTCDPLLWTLCEVALLAILQYCDQRFMRAVARMQRAVAAQVSSLALLDCLALLSIFVGLSALIGLTMTGVQSSGYWDVLRAMGIFIVCQYVAILALNPLSLNVSLAAPATPGYEVVGIGWFLLRCVAKTVPILYGLGVTWGMARLIFALYLLLSPPTEAGPWTADLTTAERHPPQPPHYAPGHDELLRIVPAQVTANGAGTVIFAAAVAPLTMFVVYVLGQWLLEVARTLLPEGRSTLRDDQL